MERQTLRKAALLAGAFVLLWLGIKYLLPLFLPFALGLLLALAAEPAVKAGTNLLKLPRWAAAGLGVTLALLLLTGLISILGAALVKELGVLAGRMPDLQETAENATVQLRSFLENAAGHAPEGIRPLAEQSISRLFDTDSSLLEQASGRVPGAITGFLSRVPHGALGLGTGILSGFMLSVRLPRLKAALASRLPESVKSKFLPTVKRVKSALGGWLKAQLKLCGITYVIVLVGLLVLGIPYAPLWAAAVALVDAVPLLGTGTVLLPWALVCLLQGQHLQAIGLICTYGAAMLTRTALEPRLVGRHLGLDPLVTLVCLYLGFRFWGIFGMLLAPMLVAAITAAQQPPAPTNGA